MNHGIKQRKLNRDSAHRKALLANLAVSLITHEQIVTTLPKAKELRPVVEKLITLAKKGGEANKRLAISRTRSEKAVSKLFETIGTRYANRDGGYTRIMKYGFRKGDSAPMAIIEFVDRDADAKGKEDYERVVSERAAAEAAAA